MEPTDAILARRAELVDLRHQRGEAREQLALLEIDWERRPTRRLTNKLMDLRDQVTELELDILNVGDALSAAEEDQMNALHDLVAQGLLDPALVPSC